MSPFQGYRLNNDRSPRALPWAIESRPFRPKQAGRGREGQTSAAEASGGDRHGVPAEDRGRPAGVGRLLRPRSATFLRAKVGLLEKQLFQQRVALQQNLTAASPTDSGGLRRRRR